MHESYVCNSPLRIHKAQNSTQEREEAPLSSHGNKSGLVYKPWPSPVESIFPTIIVRPYSHTLHFVPSEIQSVVQVLHMTISKPGNGTGVRQARGRTGLPEINLR